MKFNNEFISKQIESLDFSCGFDVITVNSSIALRVEAKNPKELSVTSKIEGWHSEDMISALCVVVSNGNILCKEINARDGRVIYKDELGMVRKHTQSELIKAYQNKGIALIVLTEVCRLLMLNSSSIVLKLKNAECELKNK